ncbi:MAG: type II toxin-antitoxin system RelE/ParE family toxin [Planctomycetes bacterium]|nr:type II toxin-antitoxin system RelE/ParE family toxin [Planctomycetota bacterium]
MRYRIAFTDRAEREFDGFPLHIQRRIARWLDLLAEDPRREGTKKLEGHSELRRVHAGKDYVIIYVVRDREVLVLVVRAARRREAYRGL